MSMVPCFVAFRFEDDGSPKDLKSFACDTDELTDLLDSEAPPSLDTSWLTSFDEEEGPPAKENCASPDTILAALAWAQKHCGDKAPTYDIDNLRALCAFAKAEGAVIALTYV